MSILFFPAINRDWFPTLKILKEAGHGLFISSSDPIDLLQDSLFDGHFILPLIYSPDFSRDLLKKIEEFGIVGILCPVPAVYAHLSNLIESGTLKTRLLNEPPIAAIQDSVIELIANARSIGEHGYSPPEKPDVNKIASVLCHARRIYGESGQEKIGAMVKVAQSCPKGDLVEIGALMGRTAFVLASTSRFFSIGKVLIIDPWERSHARQVGSPSIVQNDMVNAWDLEVLKDGFIINLLPFSGGLLNYLRLPSTEAHKKYVDPGTIVSKEFGETKYSRKIALLHIDGNHDYEQVKNDCLLWVPLVKKDGWLILDDYHWHHGDGPKRMGDWMLKHLARCIKNSFICDKALFIQFSGRQGNIMAEERNEQHQ